MAPDCSSRLLAFCAALALCAPAAGADCGDGAWRGTLGADPVSLEIDSDFTGGDAPAGRYYRGASLDELILLPLAERPGTWAERDTRGRRTGVLRFACVDGRLTGTRTPASGGARERLAAAPIDSERYAATRLANLKRRVTRLVVLDERRAWTEFSVAGASGVQGLRFLGDAPALAALNEQLFKETGDSLEEALRCRVAGYIDRGADHKNHLEDRREVLAYADELVTIGKHTEGACGGAHGYVAARVDTWNLVTQAWEDVSTWLRPDWLTLAATGELDAQGVPAAAPHQASTAAAQRDDQATPELLGSALQRFLDASGREEREECRDVVTVEFDRAHMWAQAEGLGVMPETGAYADRLCAVPFTIPYALLWPYLTETGRRHAADLARAQRLR